MLRAKDSHTERVCFDFDESSQSCGWVCTSAFMYCQNEEYIYS